MTNKKVTALVFVTALAVGLQISTIYVPDGFESPTKFRMQALVMKLGGLYVK